MSALHAGMCTHQCRNLLGISGKEGKIYCLHGVQGQEGIREQGLWVKALTNPPHPPVKGKLSWLLSWTSKARKQIAQTPENLKIVQTDIILHTCWVRVVLFLDRRPQICSSGLHGLDSPQRTLRTTKVAEGFQTSLFFSQN